MNSVILFLLDGLGKSSKICHWVWTKNLVNSKGDTEYSIRAFPLGGFTKWPGMEDTLIEGYSEVSVPDAERFDKKPIYQRSLIVAGALP